MIRDCTDAQLKELVKRASAAAIHAVACAHPNETICAFSLCTDDDLRTVFHAATTLEFCGDDEELRFVPVDWEYGEGAEFYDIANNRMSEMCDSSKNFPAHVEGTFSCLVEALSELRAEGTFSDSVTLIVTSTDPGPRLEELADEAVRRLNPPSTHAAWRQAMGYE